MEEFFKQAYEELNENNESYEKFMTRYIGVKTDSQLKEMAADIGCYDIEDIDEMELDDFCNFVGISFMEDDQGNYHHWW